MKKLLISAVLMLLASAAQATYCPDGSRIDSHPNGDCNYKPPTPQQSDSVSKSRAEAQAKAQAIAAQQQAQRQAQAQRQGQTQGQTALGQGGAGGSGGGATVSSPSQATSTSEGSTNTLGAVGNDNSSSSFRALALSLPTAVFTPPLPMDTSECAETVQSAGGLFWNGFTKADAARTTDKCTIIRLHNAYLDECQYASAKQVKDRLMVKLLPDFVPSTRVALDLTEGECAKLKLPLPSAIPGDRINFIVDAPPAVCAMPIKSPVKAKRKVKTKTVYGCPAPR